MRRIDCIQLCRNMLKPWKTNSHFYTNLQVDEIGRVLESSAAHLSIYIYGRVLLKDRVAFFLYLYNELLLN